MKSGKQTQIQEDNKIGLFDIQHIMDKHIKPGLFLARLARDTRVDAEAGVAHTAYNTLCQLPLLASWLVFMV